MTRHENLEDRGAGTEFYQLHHQLSFKMAMSISSMK